VTIPNKIFSISKRSLQKAAASEPNVIQSALPRHRRNSIENEILPIEGADLVSECNRLWMEASQKFLAIGRYLQKEFLRTRRDGTFESEVIEKLHFGRIVAYQLRTVAAAVDDGKIEEDLLPRSYATAYKLVSMPEDAFEQAKGDGLIRPDVSRPEIERFKRDFDLKRDLRDNPLEAKRAERTKIIAEVDRLKERIAVMANRISELDKEIGSVDTEKA
jgi:hypothetical protein